MTENLPEEQPSSSSPANESAEDPQLGGCSSTHPARRKCTAAPGWTQRRRQQSETDTRIKINKTTDRKETGKKYRSKDRATFLAAPLRLHITTGHNKNQSTCWMYHGRVNLSQTYSAKARGVPGSDQQEARHPAQAFGQTASPGLGWCAWHCAKWRCSQGCSWPSWHTKQSSGTAQSQQNIEWPDKKKEGRKQIHNILSVHKESVIPSGALLNTRRYTARVQPLTNCEPATNTTVQRLDKIHFEIQVTQLPKLTFAGTLARR